MKDYSRKNYADHQYRDWMRTITSKSIFNEILERYPGHAEFSTVKANKTSLDRAVESYLRQSWLKKPNSRKGFKDMEEDWEGISGIPRLDDDIPTFHFDQPWDLQYPINAPWNVVFALHSKSKYCPGETTPFLITGTNPIYHLELSFERSGTSITILGGYGTNAVYGTISAGEDEWASIDFNGSMIAYIGPNRPGVVGSANYLMPPAGSGCCDEELPVLPDDDSNPDTMAHNTTITIYVLDGVPPFKWSVTGATGFTLGKATTTARNNTLIAASGACGSPIVTVTDKCETEAEIVTRCTNNSHWHSLGQGCFASGAATSCVVLQATRVSGKYKQIDSYANTYCFGGSCSSCTGVRPYRGTPCITFDCSCILTGYCPCSNCAPPNDRKCYRPGVPATDDIYSINPSGWDWRCN